MVVGIGDKIFMLYDCIIVMFSLYLILQYCFYKGFKLNVYVKGEG